MKILIVLICLLLIISGCAVRPADIAEETRPAAVAAIDPDNYESGIMEIAVFGIGRADAILITTDNHAVLIDTGERRHGGRIAGYLLDQGIRAVDYLIITHFDSDHVGGAYIIIGGIDVQKVIVPNYIRDSGHVRRFETAMQNAGREPFILSDTMRFSLDGADFIIYPSRLEGRTGDDMSIVVSITHGGNSFLFTGDAVARRLRELLESEEIMTGHDFLKVPRHGRHNTNSVEFIHAVSPRYAVITGFHPERLTRYYPERPTDQRVIDALEYTGAEVYFAMSIGVYARSDGDGLVVIYRDFFE